MIYLLIFLLAVVSGLLYRMGGWGNEGRVRYPNLPEWFFNTKARDLGCPLVSFFAMLLLLKASWWVHLLAFGFLFGSLTTYWDFLFGYDNHWFHGFMCGVAYFPYIIECGWVGFVVRCFVLAIITGLWSLYNVEILCWDEAETEEFGRGFLIVITLFLI